jgi:hypothetical protein
MRKSLLLIPICITACASGPVLIGKNTYMMTDTAASSWASGSSIKAGLYQKANKFCMEQGKELLAIRSRQQDASMSQFGNAELQFKCLEKMTQS